MKGLECGLLFLRSLFRKFVEVILFIIHIIPTFTFLTNPWIGMIPITGGYFLTLCPWSPFIWFSETSWLIYYRIYIPFFSYWVLKPAFEAILIAIGIAVFSVACFQLITKRGKGLVTNGLYSLVRHPQALGIMLVTLGFTFQSMRPAAVVAWVTLVFGYLLMANSEERRLEDQYHDEFMLYKQQVPFILPLVPSNISERLPFKLRASRLKRGIFLLCVYLLVFLLTAIILKYCSYDCSRERYYQQMIAMLGQSPL